MTTNPPDDPGPLWVRAGPVARQLGLTLPMLEAAISAGTLPLRTLAIGKRELLYVSAPDLARYRASLTSRNHTGASNVHSSLRAFGL